MTNCSVKPFGRGTRIDAFLGQTKKLNEFRNFQNEKSMTMHGETKSGASTPSLHSTSTSDSEPESGDERFVF